MPHSHAHSHVLEPPCDDHSLSQGTDTTAAALKIVWISGAILAFAAVVEIVVSLLVHSAGVLADGLHNIGDVSAAVALIVAFRMSKRAPSSSFPYGYHRSEDVASLFVLLIIVLSAAVAGVTSFLRLLHPVGISDVPIALGTALLGFAANEAAAIMKIKKGRQLRSIALEMDGKHSRFDGLSSLGAGVGVIGSLVHLPLLDPIAGLGITFFILYVAWETSAEIGGRLLDKADPELVKRIENITKDVPGIESVPYIRARWTGRRVLAEMSLGIDGQLPLIKAHAIGEDVRYHLHQGIDPLADLTIHFDPVEGGVVKGHEEEHAAHTHTNPNSHIEQASAEESEHHDHGHESETEPHIHGHSYK